MMRDGANRMRGRETTVPRLLLHLARRRTRHPSRRQPPPAAVRGDAVVRDSGGASSFCDDIEPGSLSLVLSATTARVRSIVLTLERS